MSSNLTNQLSMTYHISNLSHIQNTFSKTIILKKLRNLTLTGFWSTDTMFWLASLFWWWCRIDSLMLFFYWLFSSSGRSLSDSRRTSIGQEWDQSMPRKDRYSFVGINCWGKEINTDSIITLTQQNEIYTFTYRVYIYS